MKLAIVGSRTFTNYDLLEKTILENFNIGDIEQIISGGAIGADTLAEQFAKKYNIPIIIFKPDWSFGKMAGLLRNNDIIGASDTVIAFWDGVSKGTKNSIDIGYRLKKRVIIHKV